MGDHSANIWRFETKRFAVILDCDWDAQLDLSFDETGETQAKVESGEWDCVNFRVRVLLDGEEIGSAHLVNSIYANVRDFRHAKDGYFPDTVRMAIAEARAEIKRRVNANCVAVRKYGNFAGYRITTEKLDGFYVALATPYDEILYTIAVSGCTTRGDAVNAIKEEIMLTYPPYRHVREPRA